MPMLIPADGFKPGDIDHKPRTSAPAGWLKCNGALVSRTTYAALFAAIGTTFGAGDGSTTFALPDLRGEFVRGLDDGRGVDSARVMGSAQTDALQGHVHSMTGATGYAGGNSGPTNYLGQNSSNGLVGNLGVGSPASDGSNGSPRTAAETRPRNVALLACIKY